MLGSIPRWHTLRVQVSPDGQLYTHNDWIDMLNALGWTYAIGVFVWCALHLAIETVFPRNQWLPSAFSGRNDDPAFIFYSLIWPLMAMYSIFVGILAAVKGITTTIAKKIEKKNQLPIIPTER